MLSDSQGEGIAAQDRREALLTAAQAVFAREGYHRAGIRQIAEAAGCAVGTFYLYFPSKSDCFRALMDRLYERVMAAIVAKRATQTSAVAKLAAALAATNDVLVTEQELSRVVLLHARGADAALENHLWTIQETFASLVAKELQECGIEPQTAQIGAYAWVGALAEVVYLWARDPEGHNLSAMMAEVERLFWRGWGLAASP